MKLTKVSARNFKGLSFTLDLASINFLVGSNFAGKTARTDAIRLLLLGYLPELGKTAKATYGLASGRELVVEGEFDNGGKISRRWFLKGDSIKTDVSGIEEDNEARAQQLAVMLDASTYFALGPTDRINYVFANCPIAGAFPALSPEIEKVLGDGFGSGFETPQEFVEAAIERAAEVAKTAKDYAGRMEKTAQGLAGLRAQDEKTVSLETIDAERATVVAEVSRLTEEKGKLAGAYEAARANKRRRDELSAAVRGKSALESRRDSVARQIDAKENDLANVPAGTPEAVEQARMQEREASTALRDHERDLREVEASIRKNEEDLAGVDGKNTCPYCGAAGDGWKALKTGQINSALAGLRTKREQLVSHVALLREQVAWLVRQFEEARDAVAERQTLTGSLGTLRADLAAVESQLGLLTAKEQELAALPEPDAGAVAAIETVQTALNVANSNLSGIDARRKLALGRKNDLERLAQAETERDKAKAEETVAKAAVDKLKEIQRKMVEDAFGPLLATANSFFGSILKSPLAYNDGEIGTWREGVWVGHRTFSGTEKALCYAAIQMALAASSPVRVMIVDELGRLDAGNAEKLLLAVGEAIKAGRIDQFIGIDATNRYETTGTLEDFAFQLVRVQ